MAMPAKIVVQVNVKALSVIVVVLALVKIEWKPLIKKFLKKHSKNRRRFKTMMPFPFKKLKKKPRTCNMVRLDIQVTRNWFIERKIKNYCQANL